MNTNIYKQKESGVALLFALGLLSLLLLLGLGFFTNISVAQKIAINSNNRTQTKMLAASAINRALMGLMLHQDNILKDPNNQNKEKPTSFDSVISKANLNPSSDNNDFLVGEQSLLSFIDSKDKKISSRYLYWSCNFLLICSNFSSCRIVF